MSTKTKKANYMLVFLYPISNGIIFAELFTNAKTK